MTAVPRGHRLAKRLAILSTAVVVTMLVSWVSADPVERLQTDWTAFDNAANRLLAGESVYRPITGDGFEEFPYLYPPFVLWLALPLATVSFSGSFLLSSATTLFSYLAGLRLFRSCERRGGDPFSSAATGMVIATASGVAVTATLVGQYSGLYVLSLGAAALLYTRDRTAAAGLILAALWIKPNIAIAVPVVLFWSRSWRVFSGFAAGTVGLLAASLPFGLERWGGFVDNARQIAELQERGEVPVRKMITVLSSIQTIFGLEAASSVSLVIWLAVAGVLGAAVLALWTPERLAESPVRAFAVFALFVVAANPRMYFYDGTLVAFGMFGLWVGAHQGVSVGSRRVVAVLAAVIWVGLWGGVFSSLNPIVGPTAAAAVIIAALSAKRSGATDTMTDTQFESYQTARTQGFAA